MLALEVEYLMGRLLATARDERSAAEWPPHPARLFAALLATLHEADLSAAEQAAGRTALEWLETLAPPALALDPPLAEAQQARSALACWVPVNPTPAEVSDVRNTPRAFIEGIRLPRKRAERHFPSYAPSEPSVTFIWQADAEASARHAPALDRLARALVCLGHSASPVRARLLDAAPPARLLPSERGELALRVPGPGRLARLEACHARGLELGRRIEAPPGRMQAYAVPAAAAETLARGGYRFAAIYRRSNRDAALPAEGLPLLVQTVRNNLLRLAPQPVPVLVSGHEADGSPTRAMHLAIAALPRVGDAHADGAPLGFAVLRPAELTTAEHALLAELLDALAAAPLTLGRHGVWQLQRLGAAELAQAARTLQPQTWSGPAQRWASVTPLVFGHHPRPGRPHRDALAIVSRHCRDLGLPPPLSVAYGPLSLLRGAAPAAALAQGALAARWRGQFIAHAVIDFAEPVAGPLLLGAGRHFGLGLMRPLAPRRSA